MSTYSSQAANADLAAQRPANRRPGQRANTPMENASRLLSETAHDLRTPLCAVGESARLVNDGYLGPTTEEQRSCLQGIFEQCEEMNQLITDMLSLEQLRSGVPCVHRRWLDPCEIERSVTKTATAGLAQRQLSLVWDRPESMPEVYADPGKTARLLLNLIGNSVQVLPGGSQVLVRVEPVEPRGVLRYTVIDHGPGMDVASIEQFTERGVSGTGGRGLGLAISRQMAAFHFSCLEISSRVGVGTRIAFELPCAGPASVADAWGQWRARFSSPSKTTPRRVAGVRLDPPATPHRGAVMGMSTVTLLHDGAPPRNTDLAVALSLRLGSTVATEVADQLEKRLQDSMRMYELAFRTDVRRWVLLLDADPQQAQQRLNDMQAHLASVLPAARMSCSDLLELPIGSRASRANVRDLLIRGSLAAPTSMPASDYRLLRTGTPLPAISQVASRRLDDELRRLTARISQQREGLRQQAAAVRTPNS